MSSTHSLEALAAKYGRETAVRSIVYPEKAESLGIEASDLLLVEYGRLELDKILERSEVSEVALKRSRSVS